MTKINVLGLEVLFLARGRQTDSILNRLKFLSNISSAVVIRLEDGGTLKNALSQREYVELTRTCYMGKGRAIARTIDLTGDMAIYRETLKFNGKDIDIAYIFYPIKSGLYNNNIFVNTRRVQGNNNNDALMVNCFIKNEDVLGQEEQILRKIFKAKGFIAEWIFETILMEQKDNGIIKSYTTGDNHRIGKPADFYITLNDGVTEVALELKTSAYRAESLSKSTRDSTTYFVLDVSNSQPSGPVISLKELPQKLSIYLQQVVYHVYNPDASQVFDFFNHIE